MNVAELTEQWSRLWLPPERLSLSEWTERNFILSPEYSAQTGPLQLLGWQRQIFDSFTDPRVSRIVLMTGTQLVKTLFIQAAIAYSVSVEPGPILVSQPKDEDASTFSRERISTMLRDIPALRSLVGEAKARDSSNTIAHKLFPGGSLSIVGANTPGNFARRTIKYLFCDEIDKYQPTAEGDQIALGIERTIWYGTRAKIILTCSPTVDGRSRIQRFYADTDQQRPWVPCPGCGERHVLKWANVRWNVGRPETARYICPFCRAEWNDRDRWKAVDLSEWRAEAPFRGARGHWISHLYSPRKTLGYMADDFLRKKAQGRDALQVFINTSLAELWREEGERPNWEILKARAEDYPCNDDAVVPMAASFVTAAVDFQREWLQVELKAWGRGRENWSLGTWRVEEYDANGNPLQTSDPKYRAWLRMFLAREWPHECGVSIPILAMGADTGSMPNPVYELARECNRPAFTSVGTRIEVARTFVPVKGASTNEQHLRLIVAVSPESAARKRGGIRIVTVGSGYAKQEFYSSLQLRQNADGSFPAGFCHFPRRYDDSVFQSYCAEERVVHATGSVEWVKVFERNEALDCHNYNRALASLVGVDQWNENHWAALERQLGITRSKPQIPEFRSQPTMPTVSAPVIQQQMVRRRIIGRFAT